MHNWFEAVVQPTGQTETGYLIKMNSLCVVVFMLSAIVEFSDATIAVIPDSDQVLSIYLSKNVTFTCNVSEDRPNSQNREAIWEIQGRQIPHGLKTFEALGIFVEQTEINLARVIITSKARHLFVETGVMVRCTVFILGPPPRSELGHLLHVQTYDQPVAPSDLKLVTSDGIMLTWKRPINIPEAVQIGYTVYVISTTSAFPHYHLMSNVTSVFLDGVLSNIGSLAHCEVFRLSIEATAADVPNSLPAEIMDTLPSSVNVSSIDESLVVESANRNGTEITIFVSFKVKTACEATYPIRNTTLSVVSSRGVVAETSTVSTIEGIKFFSLSFHDDGDQQFQAYATVCSDIICSRSSIRQLETRSHGQEGSRPHFGPSGLAS